MEVKKDAITLLVIERERDRDREIYLTCDVELLQE